MSTAEKIRAIPIDRTGTYIREVTPAAIRDEAACIAEQADAEHAAAIAEKDAEIERLTGIIRNVIRGRWSLTDLQESIGELNAAARKEPNA